MKLVFITKELALIQHKVSLLTVIIAIFLIITIQGCFYDSNNGDYTQEYTISLNAEKTLPIDYIAVTTVHDGDTVTTRYDSTSIQKSIYDSTRFQYELTISLVGDKDSYAEIKYSCYSMGIAILTRENNFVLGGTITTASSEVDSVMVSVLTQYHNQQMVINPNSNDSTHKQNVQQHNSDLMRSILSSTIVTADSTHTVLLYDTYKTHEITQYGIEHVPDTALFLAMTRDSTDFYGISFPGLLGQLLPGVAQPQLDSIMTQLPILTPLPDTDITYRLTGTLSQNFETLSKIVIEIYNPLTLDSHSLIAVLPADDSIYTADFVTDAKALHTVRVKVYDQDSLYTGTVFDTIFAPELQRVLPPFDAFNAKPWVSIDSIGIHTIGDTIHPSAHVNDSLDNAGIDSLFIRQGFESYIYTTGLPFITVVPDSAQPIHWVYIQAIDIDGNSATDSVSVSVLPVAPTVTASAEAANSISVTAAAPAGIIRYTMSVSGVPAEPTDSSSVWINNSVTSTGAYSFRVFRVGFIPSAVVTRSFTLNGIAAAPTVTESTDGANSIAVSASVSTGVIRYTVTTDGNLTTPTEDSPEWSDRLVTATGTYSFRVFRTHYTPSSIVIRNFTINGDAAAPAVTGSAEDADSISVSATAPLGTIRYTVSSNSVPSEPTDISSLWTDQSVTATGTYSFRVFHTNYNPSSVITRSYSINGSAAVPTVTVSTEAASSISVSASTLGGTIRYTMAVGSTPSEPTVTSPEWTDQSVTATGTYSFRVFRTHYNPSAVGTHTYTINGNAESATATETSEAASSISVTATAPEGTIRFTVAIASTPSEPTISSPEWTDQSITTTGTYSFRVFRTEYTPSAVITKTYTINGNTDAALVTESDSVATSMLVSATTPNGIVRYTVSSGTPSDPTETSDEWADATVAATGNYKFRVFRTHWEPSVVIEKRYVINGILPEPVAIASETVDLSKFITANASNGTLRYTVSSGTPSDPTEASDEWSDRTIVATGNYKFRAFRDNWEPSVVVLKSYVITVPLTVTPSDSVASEIDVEANSLGTVRFTFDPTGEPGDPTESSDVWSDRSITATGNYKFRAFHPDFTESSIIARRFVINGQVATPIILWSGGGYDYDTYTLSSTTIGSTIEYQIGGTSGPWEYSSGVENLSHGGSGRTIFVRAYRQNWIHSDIASQNY